MLSQNPDSRRKRQQLRENVLPWVKTARARNAERNRRRRKDPLCREIDNLRCRIYRRKNTIEKWEPLLKQKRRELVDLCCLLARYESKWRAARERRLK